MNKFKTILIIFLLIFSYFLIGTYFYSGSSYDYSDTMCFVGDLFNVGSRIISSKINIV